MPHLDVEIGGCGGDAGGECVARPEEERRDHGATLARGGHRLELGTQQASRHAAQLVRRHPVDPLEAHRPHLGRLRARVIARMRTLTAWVLRHSRLGCSVSRRTPLATVAQRRLKLSSRTPEREDGGRALRAAVEQQHRRSRHAGGSGEGDAEGEHEAGRGGTHGWRQGR